jgi:hypothetical protein
MRWALLLLVLAGCSESSEAGPPVDGPGGSVGTAGTGSAGGSGGSAGMGVDASPADAGKEAAPEVAPEVSQTSCLIPVEMISGVGPAIYTSFKPTGTSCPTMMENVQIINGVYYDTTWTLTNYMSYPSDTSQGQCSAVFTFTKTSTKCGNETLRATLTVPAV